MKQPEQSEHIFGTYRTLRRGLVVIAVLLPIILLIGNWLIDGAPQSHDHRNAPQDALTPMLMTLPAAGNKPEIPRYEGSNDTE